MFDRSLGHFLFAHIPFRMETNNSTNLEQVIRIFLIVM